MAYQSFIVGHANYTAAATTSDHPLWTAPYPCVLKGVVLNVITDFSGGSVASCTLMVGKGGAENNMLAATNVFTGASNGYANATLGTGATALQVFFNTGDVLDTRCTTTTDDCVNLTAGAAQILVDIEAVPPAQAA